MLALVLAHAAAAVVAAAAGRRLGRGVFAVVAAPLAAAFVWLAVAAPGVLEGEVRDERIVWARGVGLDLTFRLDGFSLLMGLLVTGIGVLVAWYATWYFAPAGPDGHHGPGDMPPGDLPGHHSSPDVAVASGVLPHDLHDHAADDHAADDHAADDHAADDHAADDHAHPEIALPRFAASLVGFAGAMFGLVLADDVFTLFVFWELTSITSFLLIGIDDRGAASRYAANRALLTTAGGGLALLFGLALLATQAGTSRLSEMVDAAPSGTVVNAALVLVLAGAVTKSAQVPFHYWLPGAMAAPTPVSAYLHSATMVKAGIVVVARFAPAFAEAATWRPIVITVGLLTMVWGGIRALRQDDAKLLLAYGTVSQLGLLMVLLGAGTPETTFAGTAMLAAHAVFKAPLFLVVGMVDHQLHTRSLARLGGLGRRWPVVAGASLLAAASMAGLPPLLGFVSKESALEALLDVENGWGILALGGVVAGSALTVAYSVRWWWGIFGPLDRVSGGRAPAGDRPSVAFASPALLLATLSLLGGAAASWVGRQISPMAASLDAGATGYLYLWHGWTAALGLSIALTAAGVGLFAAGPWVRRQRALLPEGAEVYDRGYGGLLDGARLVTGVLQNGSLPAYLAVVFVALAALVGTAFVQGARPDLDVLALGDQAGQPVIAALAAILAVGVVLARRRFVAVVLLGGVGYGLSLLFLLKGSPDLALTQFLVETLTIVVFLLALRHLPDRFAPAPVWAPTWLRAGIAVTVGVFMAAFAVAATGARSEPPLTPAFEARSEIEAGGRNIVNVILVDFRAADTLGEITVLAVAAAGVANLVGAARRARARRVPPDDREPTLEETSR